MTALNSELVLCPDCHFVNTPIDNLINGCDIGFTGPQFNYCSRKLHSVWEQLTTLDATIAGECKLGRFWGHSSSPHFLYLVL